MISIKSDVPYDIVVVDMNAIKSEQTRREARQGETRRMKARPDKAEHDEDLIGEIWIPGTKEVHSATRLKCFRFVHCRPLNHIPRLLISCVLFSSY